MQDQSPKPLPLIETQIGRKDPSDAHMAVRRAVEPGAADRVVSDRAGATTRLDPGPSLK